MENSTNCVLARPSVTASNHFLVASMKILDRRSRGICPTKTERQVVVDVSFEKSITKKLNERIELSKYLVRGRRIVEEDQSGLAKITFTFLIGCRFL